jgi:hypothetical protein
LHAAPPIPQALSAVPATQPVAVQQPAHVAAQESEMHVPPEQLSLALQISHAAPAVPHPASVSPVTQAPDASQQPAQLSGPHVPTQRPAVQVSPPSQASQPKPAVPHAVCSVPPRHVSPSQQPLQLSGVQAGGVSPPPSSPHATRHIIETKIHRNIGSSTA